MTLDWFISLDESEASLSKYCDEKCEIRALYIRALLGYITFRQMSVRNVVF